MCISPIRIRHPTKNCFIDVPCGKCLECFNKKVNDWSFRLKQQLMDSKTAYFFTLTYDDDSLPLKGVDKNSSKVWFSCRQREYLEPAEIDTLECFDDDITFVGHDLLDIEVLPCFKKSDVQELVRSIRDKIRYQLRKKFKAKQVNVMMKDIKYFVSSEYGETTNRPHYHGVFFGLPFDLNEFISVLSSSWNYGFVSASLCNEKRCYYAAKYALKNAATLYKPNMDKGFILVSKGLGIGFLDDSTKAYMLGGENGEYKVFIHSNGREVLIPKYYRDKVFTEEYQKDRLSEIWDNFDELKRAPATENPFMWRDSVYKKKVQKAKNKLNKEKL